MTEKIIDELVKQNVPKKKGAKKSHYPVLESSLLQATLESTADGLLVVDRQGKIISHNEKFRRMWCIPQDLINKENDEMAIKHVLSQLADPVGFFNKLMHLYQNPELDCFDEIEFSDGRIFERYSIPQRVGNEIIGRVFSFRDVTHRKVLEKELVRQATHDTLTALPNRVLLEDRIAQEIKNCKRYDKKMAVVFFDLDRFKLVNDSLGHNVGDNLLCTVAKRLSGCIRDTDTLARWGGDEFVLVLTNLDDIDDVIPIISQCQEIISNILSVDNHSISITSSVGVSFCPDHGVTSAVLLKNADAAMYCAKANGRNNYRFYTYQMNDQTAERLELASDLRRAIEENEFVLNYQPLVNLKTKKISSVEALIRWNHPIRGLISPLQFIGVAEENGLIQGVGEWVLRTACKQLRDWHDQGLKEIRMAVNMSGLQFKQLNIVQVVEKIIKEYKVDPKALDLELTESSIMENTTGFINVMNAFKEIGVGLVIDDFGTGYSSLSYLKRFPVSKLKIDRSFINDVPEDEDNRAIIQAILAMAQQLKLRVVAEGVETLEQLQFLQEQGCDEMQGYYYSYPLASEKITELLKDDSEKMSLFPSELKGVEISVK